MEREDGAQVCVDFPAVQDTVEHNHSRKAIHSGEDGRMTAIVFFGGMILGGTLGFLIAAVLSMEDRDR